MFAFALVDCCIVPLFTTLKEETFAEETFAMRKFVPAKYLLSINRESLFPKVKKPKNLYIPS